MEEIEETKPYPQDRFEEHMKQRFEDHVNNQMVFVVYNNQDQTFHITVEGIGAIYVSRTHPIQWTIEVPKRGQLEEEMIALFCKVFPNDFVTIGRQMIQSGEKTPSLYQDFKAMNIGLNRIVTIGLKYSLDILRDTQVGTNRSLKFLSHYELDMTAFGECSSIGEYLLYRKTYREDTDKTMRVGNDKELKRIQSRLEKFTSSIEPIVTEFNRATKGLVGEEEEEKEEIRISNTSLFSDTPFKSQLHIYNCWEGHYYEFIDIAEDNPHQSKKSMDEAIQRYRARKKEDRLRARLH